MTLSMKRIPDIITFLRIAAAVMLLFTTPFSIIFYLLYSWCGFSDILDGYLARKKDGAVILGQNGIVLLIWFLLS